VRSSWGLGGVGAAYHTVGPGLRWGFVGGADLGFCWGSIGGTGGIIPVCGVCVRLFPGEAAIGKCFGLLSSHGLYVEGSFI